MNSMSVNCRDLKSKLEKISSESDRLLQDAKQVLSEVNPQSEKSKVDNLNIDDIIKVLEEECGQKKKLAAQLRERFNQVF